MRALRGDVRGPGKEMRATRWGGAAVRARWGGAAVRVGGAAHGGAAGEERRSGRGGPSARLGRGGSLIHLFQGQIGEYKITYPCTRLQVGHRSQMTFKMASFS